jgi:putative transposase
VLALKADYPLAVLLDIAGLARSTYYYHQPSLDRPDPQTALKAAIRRHFEAAHGRYGHRRIHACLIREGWRVAKKTVLQLMRHLGLACPVRRRKRYGAYRGEVGQTAPNRLNREFTATAPNQKWVTDVTEVATSDGKVYLAPVMDLFDRQILAWAIGTAPTLDLTNGALRDALATLPAGQTPLVHSDQGFHYQHASWRALLAGAGATPSMSRKGNCLDNAVMENFFGHLKEECVYHATFADGRELMTALEAYIGWYNTDRLSLALRGMSPVQYRAHALATSRRRGDTAIYHVQQMGTSSVQGGATGWRRCRANPRRRLLGREARAWRAPSGAASRACRVPSAPATRSG